MKRKYTETRKTPFGLIAVTSDGEAVTRITWVENADKNTENGDAVTAEAFNQLERYAAGESKSFTVPVNLEAEVPSLEMRKWLDALRQVKYGETISYGDFAARAGMPNAPRAAGSACARNPVPIIYPCHRITRKGGALGNFGGLRSLETDDERNLNIKRKLIEHEQRYAD